MVKREYIIYLFDRFNGNGWMTTNVYLYTFMYRDVTSDSNNIEVNYIIFVIRNFDVFEVNSFFFFLKLIELFCFVRFFDRSFCIII